MNKKRLFSILIAVVMIATAINLAPVLKVWATGYHGHTGGEKTSGKYEWDYPEGNWSNDGNGDKIVEHDGGGNHNGSLVYTNDGEYASTAAPGGFNNYTGVNMRDDYSYRTRHVTMFNKCDVNYQSQAWSPNNTGWGWTPFYQMDYTRTGQYDGDFAIVHTNRDHTFTVDDKTTQSQQNYGIANDKEKLKYWKACVGPNDSPYFAPWLVQGYGCVSAHEQEKNQWTTKAAAATWAGNQLGSAQFYSDTKDNCDFRMAFRNFYNTDKTIFNPYKNENKLTGEEAGINIGEYDYIEFDLHIKEEANWKRTRTIKVDGKDKENCIYTVLAYYETNCAAGEYCDQQDSYIKGWPEGGLNFESQLRFDANGNYIDTDKWVTIRVAIPDSVKDLKDSKTDAPTVKQLTIRMAGGNKGGQLCLSVDDIRLVKNDDHIGKVMTHDEKGNYITDADLYQYPSGEYFMINDFEFTGSVQQKFSTTGTTDTQLNTQKGVVQPYASLITESDSSGKTDKPYMYRMYRNQEINADDDLKKIASSYSGDKVKSWNNLNWANTATTVYGGSKNVGVTQGDYATVLAARDRVYTVAGWSFPAYYERHYSNTIDLSNFTHFSMDIYIRSEAGGIKKNSDKASTADGVVLEIDLFDTNGGLSKDGGDDDNFNYKNTHSVRFLLPYGKECWDTDELLKNGKYGSTASRYGKILPLGGTGSDSLYCSFGSTTQTASGAMRLTFTREELLAGMKSSGVGCLDKINAMRFLWINRKNTKVGDYHDYSVSYSGGSAADLTSENKNRVDIVLDNFIAYNVDTSITVKNEVSDTSYLDADQSFVYRLQGGYAVDDAQKLLEAKDFKSDGSVTSDASTKDVDLTFTVPANGSTTIRNVPYGALYLSQQSWAWRYDVNKIAITAGNGGDVKNRSKGNTVGILPVHTPQNKTPIWDIMKQRHFTVTFIQRYVKRDYGVDPNDKNKVPANQANGYDDKRWLDGAHTY